MVPRGTELVILYSLALFLACAIAAASRALGRTDPPRERLLPYECGLDPVGRPRGRFSVKYFAVAALFVVFDVEIVFLYPWAKAFRASLDLGTGAFMLAEMGIFAAMLLLALAYAWGRGALDLEE